MSWKSASAEPETCMAFLNEMEFRTLTKRVADKAEGGRPDCPRQQGLSTSTAPMRRRRTLKPCPSTTPPIPASVTHDGPLAPLDRPDPRPRPCRRRYRNHQPGRNARRTRRHLAVRRRRDRRPISRLGHRKAAAIFSAPTAWWKASCRWTTVLAALKPVLEDPAILKIGQNMKYDWKIFARHGIHIAPVRRHHADVLCHAGGPEQPRHGRACPRQYLGHKPIPIKELIGSGKIRSHLRPRRHRRRR